MSDWADEIAKGITGECYCHEGFKSRNLIDPECGFHEDAAEIAAALRKAKKDGMEEAAKLGDALSDDAPDGGLVDNGGLRVGWQSACAVYQEKIRQLKDKQP